MRTCARPPAASVRTISVTVAYGQYAVEAAAAVSCRQRPVYQLAVDLVQLVLVHGLASVVLAYGQYGVEVAVARVEKQGCTPAGSLRRTPWTP